MKDKITAENFNEYIKLHTVRKITLGKSGSDIYELDNSCIAKHSRRKKLKKDSLWNPFVCEYMFYNHFSSGSYCFLPEIYYCNQSKDEIQIIMKKYQPLNRQNFDDDMLEKIMSVLAQIHSLSVPNFLQSENKPLVLKQWDILRYSRAWKKIVKEHGDAFSKNDISRIAENINTLNLKLHSTKQRLCHGDFHLENLLEDDKGNIIVCDWQGVSLGNISGDISHFLSRLSADGYNISKEKAIQIYCKYARTDITEEEIAIQMSLANLNNSFMFWHDYLHGCTEDAVHNIFDKMVEDMEFLLSKIDN